MESFTLIVVIHHSTASLHKMAEPAAKPQKNPSGSDETFNDTEKQVYGVPQDTKVNDALEMSPEGELSCMRLFR